MKRLREKRNRSSSQNDDENTNSKSRKHLSKSSKNEDDMNCFENTCGKVMYMQLINFMCHANLMISFHSRINFIVGRNGAGKSAISTALVVGLGFKAKDTNRSGSLQNFIKNGESSASIKIVISNNGPDAYKPREFGSYITIVRKIAQNASTIKLISEAGVVVSKKLDDMHKIALSINIQPDNPIFVLNQDSAREFLKDSNPKKNYEIFAKAIQLDTIDEIIGECERYREEEQCKMAFFENKIKMKENSLEKLKMQLNQILSYKIFEENLQLKKREYLWLIVASIEQNSKQCELSIEGVTKQKHELMANSLNKDDLKKELSLKIKELENQIRTEKNQYIQQEETYDEIRKELIRIEDNIKTLQRYITNKQTQKNYYEEQITMLTNNTNNQLRKNTAEEQHNLLKKINLLKKKREDFNALILSISDDAKGQNEHFLNINSKLSTLSMSKQKNIEILESLRRTLKAMNHNSFDKISLYGSHMKELVAIMNKYYQENKFSELPRGPIGTYVDVPNDMYRDIIEKYLSRFLHIFVTNNNRDRHVLSDIVKKNFSHVKPTIITTRFIKTVYNVRDGMVKPPKNTQLLMNEINCTDAVAMNTMIDRLQVETILLTTSKSVAEDITCKVENIPKNLSKVFCLNTHNSNTYFEFYPLPNYRMYTNSCRKARYIQCNVKDRLKHIHEDINKISRSIADNDNESQQITAEKDNCVDILKKARSKSVHYKSKINDITVEIEKLENIDVDHELEILQNELKGYNVKLNAINALISDHERDIERETEKTTDLRKNMKEKQKNMHSCLSILNKTKENLESTTNELQSLDENDELIKRKLTALDEKLNIEMARKCEIDEKYRTSVAEAENSGERITSKSSLENVKNEISKLQAKVKHKKLNAASPNKIQEEIENLESTIEDSRNMQKDLQDAIEVLDNSLKKRRSFKVERLNSVACILKHSFRILLKIREYTGNIEVDHGNRTINMSVIPRAGKSVNTDNTRALSGGERSFSTVAFLISLWHSVDHKFFLLDEYDVFTDEVNRELITRLLITEGVKHPDRQYIFLTPLDLKIEASDNLRIHRFE